MVRSVVFGVGCYLAGDLILSGGINWSTVLVGCCFGGVMLGICWLPAHITRS